MLKDSLSIAFFKDEMALVQINAEKDTLTAKKYSVRGYPTLVMVDKDGKEVDRLVGYLDVERFLKTFRDYSKGIGTLDDLLHRADTAAMPDRAMYMEIADKYKYRGEGEQAVNWFQKVITTGAPLDSLTGEARIALADALRSAKLYDQAIASFQQISSDFQTGSIAEDAQIWTAICYRQKGDTATAVAKFQQFVSDHPQAEAVEYCNEQIKKLTTPPAPKETDSAK